MGNPYLNRDESIILTTHNVKLDQTVTELILTDQRLILFDSAHAQFRFQTIALTTIQTVLTGEDAEAKPIISLTISPLTKDGAPQTKELVFPRQEQGEWTEERDKWAKQLKEQIASARRQAPRTIQPFHTRPDIIFEETKNGEPVSSAPADSSPGETRPVLSQPVITPSYQISELETGDAGLQATPVPLATEPAVPPGQPEPASPEKPPLPDRFPPEPAPAGKPRFMTIAAVIIMVIAIATIGYIFAASPPGEPSAPSPTPVMTTAAATATVTTLQQTPTPTLPITVTSQPTSLPVVLIPDRGVWIRVHYAGNYTGRAGTSGYEKKINASGEQFYQIPVTRGIVEVSVQKQDGSGKVITAEVYNDGTMVANSTKATPFGTLDLITEI